MKVSNYITEDGKEPFDEWIKKLRDVNARMRVRNRIDRITLGNFGDSHTVGGGVSELRIDYSVGYRVYFAKYGDEVVLLLCGGTKERQDDDIKQAKEYWKDYKARKRGK